MKTRHKLLLEHFFFYFNKVDTNLFYIRNISRFIKENVLIHSFIHNQRTGKTIIARESKFSGYFVPLCRGALRKNFAQC